MIGHSTAGALADYGSHEDIKVIGIDLTKRGGLAAAKAIETNRE